MEEALEMNKGQLFRGEFPKDMTSILGRFRLNVGFKAQDFARIENLERQSQGLSKKQKWASS